jgi:hypothetical protein
MAGRRFFPAGWTAFWVVLSLLFSQLALAGYVCPAASAGAPAMAEMAAVGVPCEGMDMDQPVLCFQYQAGLSLSFEPVQPVSPSLPAIVQTLVLPLLPAAIGQAMPQQAVPERQHPPPDPVFLATRRLRV